MTTESFIRKIEGYYGIQYRQSQRPYMVQYLDKINERGLDYLFAQTIKSFSSQYGKAPDIAVLESYRDEACKMLEQESQLALPPANEELNDADRALVQKALEDLNAMFGISIPTGQDYRRGSK